MAPAQYWLTVGFLLVGGIFSILGAWRDWDFFFDNRRARRFVKVIGRRGARIFYAVVGVALAAGGAVLLALGPAALIEGGQ